MALTDDQKAMLRLLAQREQGYEDMAALMGTDVEEVRAKVSEALAELDKAGPAEAPPAQAPPQQKPAEAPAATPPPPRQERQAPKKAPSRPRPKVSVPSDPRARLGIAGAAAILVFLVLLVAGVFGGGGSDDSEESAAGSSDDGSIAAVNNPDLTQAVLSPVDGGDASGRAVFGRIDRTAVLQVDAEGLEPSPAGETYTVWLYRSPKVVLRVGAVRVDESGGISVQFPLPTELLAYIAGGAFDQIDVSLTPNAAYRAEVAAARRERRLPVLVGESVLRGKIAGRLIEAGRAAAQQQGRR